MKKVSIRGCCLVLALGCGATVAPAPAPMLRVGTTGDYPPYSLRTSEGFEGIDIELARDLGRELGRPVEFLATNSATVVQDALSNRFDLAIGGFNVTDSRRMLVDFSVPYAEDIRSLVVRCDEQTRFSALEELNRSAITVFVRAGGISEVYARTRLPEAHVQPYQDLEAMYARLSAGEGDAIVATDTDSRRFEALCNGLGGARFHPTQIAVILPRDSELTETVNRWLERRINDGTVRQLLQHHGVESPGSTGP